MNNDLSSWSPCEGEELQSLGRDLRQKGRAEANAAVARKCIATVAVVALLALSITTVKGMLTPGDITCRECYQSFASYAEHLEGDQLMESNKAAEMEHHLAECSRCRNKFEDKYPGLLSVVSQTAALGLISLLLLFSKHSSPNNQS